MPPASSVSEISEAEAVMRVQFPEDLRKLLFRHDGSGEFSISPYKIGGGNQRFMPLKTIVATWKRMVKIGATLEKDGEFGEQTGPIKQNYWNKRWIPFTENGCGDNIFLDLDPDKEGALGQVVDWWHEKGESTFQ